MTDRLKTPTMLAMFLVVLMLAPALPAAAQAADPEAPVALPAQSFPDCCPRPSWWDATGEVAHIDSMDQFNAVWQDQTLSNEQKSKALFQAIEDHYLDNDDITAAAVTYFFPVARSYAHLPELTEFGVGRYLDYDRPMQGYSGLPGDLSAGMVRNLAGLYIDAGEPERAVPLLRHILGPRAAEVNDHLKEFAALYLAQALAALGRAPEAVQVLLDAKDSLHGDWEVTLDKELARLRDRMGPEYYFYDRRISGPALLLLLGAVLALGIIWRQRARRV